MKPLLSLILGVLYFGCSCLGSFTSSGHDNQFIQVFFQAGFNELDTFNGTYQKDLIPGIARTRMWLTASEQDTILRYVNEIEFFSFPDTIFREPFMITSPDPGPLIIRIKYRDHDRKVVWFFPPDQNSMAGRKIRGLDRLLRNIIGAKPEFKVLPNTNGVYQ